MKHSANGYSFVLTWIGLLPLCLAASSVADTTALSVSQMPAWVTSVEQTGGVYEPADHSWRFPEALNPGDCGILIELDRQQVASDLAFSLVVEGQEGSDAVIQLLDNQDRIVAVDLFTNIFGPEGRPAGDTFILPVKSHPSATRIAVRQVEGSMTVFGMMLYPVTTKSETDMLDQIDTAMLFDNPLSPDGEIWKAALDASNTADQSALLSQYDAGAGEAYIGHLHPVETVHLFTSSARWGLPIGQSWGRVVYRRTGEGSFSGRLVLDGLPPERTYVLCLNSFEDHESGRHLPQVYEDERYYDFEQIRTDADGAVDKTFSVALPPAAYHVKFLVKDPSDWRVMLHSDFVRFEVTPGATSSDISAPGGEALP